MPVNRSLPFRRATRGMSLVELMVGIAIGLIVVAAAVLTTTTQLRDNRLLLLETQLQQDLRASTDIIARELRRAGFTDDAYIELWNPDLGSATASAFSQLTIGAGSQGSVQYNYKRLDLSAGGAGVFVSSGPFGYWLDNGVIKVRLTANAPVQDLTDRNVMFVEQFSITPLASNPVRLPCPNDCPLPIPAGQTAEYCWPTIAVRELEINITARSVSDAAVRRSVDSRVRLRNDDLRFNAGLAATPQACPD